MTSLQMSFKHICTRNTHQIPLNLNGIQLWEYVCFVCVSECMCVEFTCHGSFSLVHRYLVVIVYLFSNPWRPSFVQDGQIIWIHCFSYHPVNLFAGCRASCWIRITTFINAVTTTNKNISTRLLTQIKIDIRN